MKKVLRYLSFCCLLFAGSVQAQSIRECGIETRIKNNPAFAQRFNEIRANQLAKIESFQVQNGSKSGARTTQTTVTVPVIFHIILDQSQIDQLGGLPGIQQRIDSQMVVINRDYNGKNPDKVKIPAAWQSLYGNVGIRFSLAKLTPAGATSTGYEITTVTAVGFAPGGYEDFSDAKHAATGGIDSWDINKYLNVWVIAPVSGNLIGATVPRSFTSGPGASPLNENGVVIHYGTLGARSNPSEYYISFADRGRTLTHELGHYFEIWHTWGDDNGLCPGNGGDDDGIADTPPQADHTFGAPLFPKYDACTTSGNGIMFMNYMDYSDDTVMHLFTTDQVDMMRVNIVSGGESYSLTQHPELVDTSTTDSTTDSTTAVSKIVLQNNFAVVPNPTNGMVKIMLSNTDKLQAIIITNVAGQVVMHIATNDNNNVYTADLSGMSKGMYFVQSQFATGTVTRKIVLQ